LQLPRSQSLQVTGVDSLLPSPQSLSRAQSLKVGPCGQLIFPDAAPSAQQQQQQQQQQQGVEAAFAVQQEQQAQAGGRRRSSVGERRSFVGERRLSFSPQCVGPLPSNGMQSWDEDALTDLPGASASPFALAPSSRRGSLDERRPPSRLAHQDSSGASVSPFALAPSSRRGSLDERRPPSRLVHPDSSGASVSPIALGRCGSLDERRPPSRLLHQDPSGARRQQRPDGSPSPMTSSGGAGLLPSISTSK
jgi:hypothetical protein